MAPAAARSTSDIDFPTALKTWGPLIALLFAMGVGYAKIDNRVAVVESKVSRTVARDRLQAKFICRTLGSTDPLCVEAMDSIGGD